MCVCSFVRLYYVVCVFCVWFLVRDVCLCFLCVRCCLFLLLLLWRVLDIYIVICIFSSVVSIFVEGRFECIDVGFVLRHIYMCRSSVLFVSCVLCVCLFCLFS